MTRRIIVHHRYRVKHIGRCDQRCGDAVVTRVEFEERAHALEPWRQSRPPLEQVNLPARLLSASLYWYERRERRERRGAA